MQTHTGERLRMERERLGMSQEAFGALGGVRKQAQLNYEKGERNPDSAYLAAVAAAGVDVTFVVTGRVNAASLSAEEETLIGYYRKASADVRRTTLGGLIGGTNAGAGMSQSQGVNLTNHGHGAVQIGSVGGNVSGSIKRR